MAWTFAVLALGVVLLVVGLVADMSDPLIGIGLVLLVFGAVASFTTRNRTSV